MEEEIDYAELEELRGDGYFDENGHFIQTCANSEDY